MRPSTTLVLGAGASCPYGYPTGEKLREELANLLPGSDNAQQQLARKLGVGLRTLREFVDEFRTSGMKSIDAFLSRHMEPFAGVGKKAIALVLLRREHKSNLFGAVRQDHWDEYLHNLMVAETWEQFDPSWLSIVTFNYDRSLERYLCSALCSTYGRSEQEVVEKLESLRIVHVYGCLGTPWNGPDFLDYGHDPNDAPGEAMIQVAASRLKVIPEGRQDSPTLIAARDVLTNAERICVLGFGFDSINTTRLGAPATFQRPEGVPKIVAATCLNMTNAEMQRAAGRVMGNQWHTRQHLIRPLNCTGLLRETLFLEL